MKEVGDYLRNAREAKGLSLKDIQEITKIRLFYLEAIERGDLEVIPGEVYRRGFIVNYANAVGLDEKLIMEKYSRINKVQEEAARLEDIKIAPLVKKKVWKFVPKKSLIWAGLTLVALIMIGSLIVSGLRTTSGENSTRKLKSTKSGAISPNRAEKVPNKNAADNLTADDKAEDTTTSQILPAPVTVYADFSERVWVRVLADGEAVFLDDGAIFDPTSPKQVWTARKELVIEIGNPAGIHLNLNGRDLGPLGERGIKKTIKLTVDGLVAP